jgi:hypothetical protein
LILLAAFGLSHKRDFFFFNGSAARCALPQYSRPVAERHTLQSPGIA